VRHNTPTGRRRFRVQRRIFRDDVVVLQVEYHGLSTTWCAGQIDSEWITYWRDARVADLTVEERPQ
jgi:hypothetical protein